MNVAARRCAAREMARNSGPWRSRLMLRSRMAGSSRYPAPKSVLLSRVRGRQPAPLGEGGGRYRDDVVLLLRATSLLDGDPLFQYARGNLSHDNHRLFLQVRPFGSEFGYCVGIGHLGPGNLHDYLPALARLGPAAMASTGAHPAGCYWGSALCSFITCSFITCSFRWGFDSPYLPRR